MIVSTVSDTKNRLSELLRRVQAGETLLILDRDRPIARVTAVEEGESNPHLVPPRDRAALKKVLGLPIGGKRGRSTGALKALLEEREEGR